MTRPELVIFDCDGVLVDSETVSNRVLAENLTRHGLPMTLERCMELFVGGTMRGVGEQARGMGADLPADWVDEIYAETYAALRAGVDVIAGIPELLDHLDAARIPYAVGSNGSEAKMQITLGQNGLLDRFNGAIFSAHTLKTAKPDPDLYLAAAAHFSVAPDRAVVLEDSATGATAAARAGMRCLGYAPHGDGAALKAKGAEIIDSMYSVPALIGLQEAAE
ncbi:HAD family hydrolase [Nioella sediminis]|jgi:HAD superfamily hydrolase (TIGR01509 family)|uniref:HAD family hydrolase n=1 Tax=Nioella sediminis TaxID=1912092 RepID=UPI0008FD6A06|nr:HAD family phosphatase [Nioella sediminis]TBX28396.1 haloacid dehalogenase [Roseovarius sp. JS7-11]